MQEDQRIVVLMFVPDNGADTDSVCVDLFESFEDAIKFAKSDYILNDDKLDLGAYQRCSATIKEENPEDQEFAASGALTLFSTMIR